ncbi:hypothetical protein B0T26DRAFT_288216 [Lasiosphaeria miniovina]|uniref:GAT domain-containing protein n=1 Tax=Lasiosphaeria miniovina TaxID=1954250 RepID=A0AA40DVJ7_9PEZI|nr:uncharacterized protein B0T26DRAFT_288216 [Lasiosphaeria miniovina]KAK0717200.1 hypothetical protein B0T26DRAFT_288216 [Lasiosphaeria miniovina]
MKGFSMNKVLGSIKKKPTFGGGSSDSAAPPNPENESPEAVAARCVKQFCESGGSQGGDDVTFLPYIVDAAESSPAAAAESARLIRKFLHHDYWSKPSFQYNAIMLIRILSDNPGPTFTRNLDKKFVDVTKELLRSGRDPSVRQLLMETLDAFENTKGYDEGLGLIIEMWKKEKEKAYKAYGGRPVAPLMGAPNGPAFPPGGGQAPARQEYFSRSHSNRRLPDPIELANRLEEARTSAKLLEQVVACTPPSEILSNDLIKEFSDRCLSASRSIQSYMTADSPPPDNDTMESLIDTNEQLQQALNQHQRSVLNAKKQIDVGERSNNPSPAPPPHLNTESRSSGGWQPQPQQPPQLSLAPLAAASFPQSSSQQQQLQQRDLPAPPPPPPGRRPTDNGKGKATADSANLWERDNAVAGPSRSATGTPQQNEADPFRDPSPARRVPESLSRNAAADTPTSADSETGPRLPYEPYHPGGFTASFGESTTLSTGAGSGAGGQPRHDLITPVSDDGGIYETYNDAYSATPKKPTPAEPVYRY